MAGGNTESFGNRQLWQTISGAGFLKPLEYVEHELQKNKDKLLKGFSFYRKQRIPVGDALSKERKLKKEQHDFVIKLGHFLRLDELQSHDLFCAYLFTEYRGSRKHLTHILSHERHSQTLLLRMADFYYRERLYLIRCVRNILHTWMEEEHPYKELFAKFVTQLLENNLLKQKLLEQFEEVCNDPLPTKDTNGPLMDRAQVMGWALQNLKEQAELLELMFIYYKGFEMDVETLLQFCSRFKNHDFGWGQTYKHLIDSHMVKLVQRIGYVELLILLEGMDIMNALESLHDNKLADHVILSSDGNVDKLDKELSQLRSERVYGPLLLGWSILLCIRGEVQQAGGEAVSSPGAFEQSHRLGNIALRLGVFDFLLELVNSEFMSGKSDFSLIAHYIVYAITSATLTLFHEDTIGNTETLYKIAAVLLKHDFIADELWDKDESEGLSILYKKAMQWFPFEFDYFVCLNTSLASASLYSAQKVKSTLHKLSTYTESIDNNEEHDLQHTKEQGVFILCKNKYPFRTGDFVIRQQCKGTVATVRSDSHAHRNVHQVIRWETTYNGWHYFMGEVHELLVQVSHGAGMVQIEQLNRVIMIMELVKEILSSDSKSVPIFFELLDLSYQLISRFAVLTPAPVDLLGHTIQCLALSVPQFHSEIYHRLKQIGFLPFQTESISDFSKVENGEGISQGVYGCVLGSTEIAQGVYQTTLAVLDLVMQLVEASSKTGSEREHLASVLFIMREVFPHFHKWRYVDISQRKLIGEKCLGLFHKIFNFVHLREKLGGLQQNEPSLQESCVFSLLFTEAGHSLLEIVGTGVDNIQMALAQQASLMEGTGIELLELVEMSLSLLNRLLLLKSPDLGTSPFEQALSSLPSGRQHQHLVATIAQYVYHRHSHRLPVLATVLLKRMAMVSPISILACLGSDAEPIRDLFLTRLQSVSEDATLRVAILEMLSTCVDTQPGLFEIFLNVQQPGGKGSDSTKHDFKLGQSSCLPILLDLIEVDKQCTYECPPELLCASLDLIHVLWYSMKEIPMAVLRQNQSFWPSVLAPLKTKLQKEQDDDNDVSIQQRKLQIKLCSFSLRIVAMEIYAMAGVRLDATFKKTLQATFSDDRLLYWSQIVQESMVKSGEQAQDEPIAQQLAITEHSALILLLAWKSFLVTASRFKVTEVQLTERNKVQLLDDLCTGIQAQFKITELTEINMKLASVSSALYFTLSKIWGKEYFDSHMSELSPSQKKASSLVTAIENLTNTIHSSSSSEGLLPSVHIGLLGAVTTILQHCGAKLDDMPLLTLDLLPAVCSIFLQYSAYLPTLLSSTASSAQKSSSLGVHLKLQIMSCCLMEEILHIVSDPIPALKVLQEQGIVPCILSTIEALFKVPQGIPYIYSCLLLLTKIADIETGANMVLNSGVPSHLCLALISCYSSEDCFQPRGFSSQTFGGVRTLTASWHTVYCLSLNLFASMLRVLRFSFLDDAFNIVGVHQDRMQQALEVARFNTSSAALEEANATCNFILQLCAYHKQWRFHLPGVLAKLMRSLMSMMQTYIALLVRPQYLLHLLEHPKSQDVFGKSEASIQTQPGLQHVSSLDDVEQPTSKLVETQTSMLKLVSKGCLCIKNFTPALPEILIDQSTAVTEWEPVLSLGFSTPSLDDNTGGISFGTLLNCVSFCVRQLVKTDGKVSPQRSSPDDQITKNQNQLLRPVVQLVLELSLVIIMSQACRYLRDPALTVRDRQFLKRELGTELNSCLSPLHRQLRRGGVERSLSLTPPHHTLPKTAGGQAAATTASDLTTPPSSSSAGISSGSGGHHPSLTPQLSRSVSQNFVGIHDPAFFTLVQDFVQKALK